MLSLAVLGFVGLDHCTGGENASVFRPVTKTDVDIERNRFHEELQRLWRRLGDNVGGWNDYLLIHDVLKSLDRFSEAEFDEREEAIETVSQSYYRMKGLHDGLDLPEMQSTRHALGQLRKVMIRLNRSINEAAELQEWKEAIELYEDNELPKPVVTQDEFQEKSQRLQDLIAITDIYGDSGQLRELGNLGDWMRNRAQMASALASVDSRFGRPNLVLKVSAHSLGDMTVTHENEVEPVQRSKDGVQITGHATARGSARLYPVYGGLEGGRCEVRFSGDVVTCLHGSKGPASFDLRGDTTLFASKPVRLTAFQLDVDQSQVQAKTKMTTLRVCSKPKRMIGRLVRRIAGNQIRKEDPATRRDISKEAADSFVKRFDEQVRDEISEAQRSLQNDVHTPLRRLDLSPRLFDFYTDPQALQVSLKFGSGVAKPSESLPPINTPYDLQVMVHESMINSICESLLSGRPIESLREVPMILGAKLPEEDLAKIPDDVGLSFSVDRPVSVVFYDNRMQVTISAEGWQIANLQLDNMKVGFEYRLNSSNGKLQLELQDKVIVSPTSGGKSARFGAQESVLRRNLVKWLPKSLPIESIAVDQLPEMVDRLGNLNFPSVHIRDGWLRVVIHGDRQTAVAGIQ